MAGIVSGTAASARPRLGWVWSVESPWPRRGRTRCASETVQLGTSLTARLPAALFGVWPLQSPPRHARHQRLRAVCVLFALSLCATAGALDTSGGGGHGPERLDRRRGGSGCGRACRPRYADGPPLLAARLCGLV